MKKIICLAASAFILFAQAKAQLNCGTDPLFNKLKTINPEIREVEFRLNAAIKDAIEKEKATGILFGKTTATTYDVPIVVHIVHDYGAENLTDDAIFDAVAYWDNVFNNENADTADVIMPFKKYVGNPQIRLHLATIDPSGNPTKGITRRASYLTMNGSDNAKMDNWPNSKYINVWFVNKFNVAHSGAAAYAYYPAAGAFLPYYDGVISQAAYIATDKTIPHELGHVLNLQHTWGNTNDPNVACGNDLVDDTPPTKGHTNCLPAALYDNTCSIGYAVGPINYPDTNNTQNIMEYAYCPKMFTIGQVNRMRAAITSSVAGRNNLISASNIIATGALKPRPDLLPIPDFSVEKGVYNWGGSTPERSYFLCQNGTTKFRFKNASWNDTITAVNWSFSNDASTPSSTLLSGNVNNSFNKVGWATVTLAATGNNTGTQTINRQAVYVASTAAKTGGYNQYFTSLDEMKEWPMFNYYNNGFKWEYIPTNGYPNGWGCVRYKSFDTRTGIDVYSGNPEGDYDDLFSPAFNFTTISSPSGKANLNFYTAGSLTSKSAYNDSMQIFASNTCGETWVRINVLKFFDMIKNGVQDAEFAPTNASQWTGQTIEVPMAMRSDKTFFRFRYWPSTGGNNLYFDNFTVSPYTTEIKEIAQSATEVKLFPNPTNGNTKLCFTTGNSGDASYLIRDVTGKVIVQENLHDLPNTFVQKELSRNLFPSAGIYLITLTQSEQTITQKLIVE